MSSPPLGFGWQEGCDSGFLWDILSVVQVPIGNRAPGLRGLQCGMMTMFDV